MRDVVIFSYDDDDASWNDIFFFVLFRESERETERNGPFQIKKARYKLLRYTLYDISIIYTFITFDFIIIRRMKRARDEEKSHDHKCQKMMCERECC